jgi:serine protease Do
LAGTGVGADKKPLAQTAKLGKYCNVNNLLRATLIVWVLAAAPAKASLDLARALNEAFASVYESVSPSVVVIEVRRTGDRNSILPEGWEFFFRSPRGGGGEMEFPSQGSGVILSADGLILTNHHVVAPAAPGGITVILKDGRRLPATIVGMDDKTDLAVLQIDAGDLPAAQLGDSDQVRVGQFAFALGAPMELPYTFTFGLVSATDRSNLTRSTLYENYIQTDAAINPGNSGGPLVDIEGRVIGINTMISGINRGLGFAIPINMVKNVAAQLIAHGEVIRPWLGISIAGIEESERLRSQFSPLESGVVVQAIFFETPASQSELRAGDVILRVDESPVRRAGDVQKAVLRRSVGDAIALDVWRGGKESRVEIKAGRQPAEPRQASMAPPILPAPDEAIPAREFTPGDLTPASLGMEIQSMDPGALQRFGLGGVETALLVTQVSPGSAAEASGIEEGDILVEANHLPVGNVKTFGQFCGDMDPQRGLLLTIVRDGGKTFAFLKP